MTPAAKRTLQQAAAVTNKTLTEFRSIPASTQRWTRLRIAVCFNSMISAGKRSGQRWRHLPGTIPSYGNCSPASLPGKMTPHAAAFPIEPMILMVTIDEARRMLG
jgi:hypothetical protein